MCLMPVVSDYTAILPSSPELTWNDVPNAPLQVFVTYSFELDAPLSMSQVQRATFRPFEEADLAFARQALERWDQASGVTFLEVRAGEGDIRFSIANLRENAGLAPPPFFTSQPNGDGIQRSTVDVFIDDSIASFGADFNIYVYQHEIGHALGLKHPFDGDLVLSEELDNLNMTVMAYLENGDVSSVPVGAPLGPLDFAAIQSLYGISGAPVLQSSWNARDFVLTQAGNGLDNVMLGVNVADNMRGGLGDDTLCGFGGRDTLNGDQGDDVIYGAAGDDTLLGGDGVDVLNGGVGSDAMTGGAGNDIYYVDIANDSVRELADSGRDKIVLLDISTYDIPDHIEDVVAVSSDGVRLAGNDDANRMTGTYSSDSLIGLEGNDLLVGGEGRDRLTGGYGRDYLKGGDGADVFDFNSWRETRSDSSERDYIYDFVRGVDDIDLATLDASYARSGNQRFTFIGSAAFDDRAGELRAVAINKSGTTHDTTMIEGDLNGDGRAEFQIQLRGLYKLSADDFIL
jgi:Ca2+-binding RTX toxin-like protein